MDPIQEIQDKYVLNGWESSVFYRKRLNYSQVYLKYSTYRLKKKSIEKLKKEKQSKQSRKVHYTEELCNFSVLADLFWQKMLEPEFHKSLPFECYYVLSTNITCYDIKLLSSSQATLHHHLES